MGIRLVWSMRPVRVQQKNFGRSPAIIVSCGQYNSTILTATGQVWMAGFFDINDHRNHQDHPLEYEFKHVPFGAAYIVLIACGHSHTMAKDTEGVFLSWGYNNNNQLGYIQNANAILHT